MNNVVDGHLTIQKNDPAAERIDEGGEMTITNTPRLNSDFDPSEYIAGFTDEADAVLRKARALVSATNQDTLDVSHVWLAMALTKDGAQCLRDNHFDDRAVWDFCWLEFRRGSPVAESAGLIRYSELFREVFEDAATLAQRRGVRNQAIDVGDLLRSISSSRINERFEAFCKGRSEVPSEEATRNNVQVVKRTIDAFVPQTHAQVEVNGQGIADIRATVGSIRHAIGDRSDPKRSMFEIIAASERKTEATLGDMQRRLEGKVKTVKHLTAYCLGLTAVCFLGGLALSVTMMLK